MTASKVTPYTKPQVDQRIDTEIGFHANNLHGTTVTEKATDEAAIEHMSATNNPHAVTAAQVGAYTKAEVDALIAAVTATLIDGGSP